MERGLTLWELGAVARMTAPIDPLVARCLRGERAAFDELYLRYAPAVGRTCRALVHDTNDAEDALQQVFTQAFQGLHRFRGDSDLTGWLRGIAYHVIANQRRSYARRKRLAQAVSGEANVTKRRITDPAIACERHQAAHNLRSLLGTLDDNKRTAFLLHHGEGLSLPDVAAIMKASVQTTFARIKAARIALSKALGTNTTLPGGRP